MKQDNNKIKILISGGGTGGHIFPALSIANAMRRRLPDCEILFVGALGRMEMERVPAAKLPYRRPPGGGLRPQEAMAQLRRAAQTMEKHAQGRRIVADFAPDAAVGVGGYASRCGAQRGSEARHTDADTGTELICRSDQQTARAACHSDMHGLRRDGAFLPGRPHNAHRKSGEKRAYAM